MHFVVGIPPALWRALVSVEFVGFSVTQRDPCAVLMSRSFR